MLSDDELRRLGAEIRAATERDFTQAGVTDAGLHQGPKHGSGRVPMLYQQHAHDPYARSTLAKWAGDLDQARHLATEAAPVRSGREYDARGQGPPLSTPFGLW